MISPLFEPCADALDRLRASIRKTRSLSAFHFPTPIPCVVPAGPDGLEAETRAAAAAAVAALDRLPAATAFFSDGALSNHLSMWRWERPGLATQ